MIEGPTTHTMSKSTPHYWPNHQAYEINNLVLQLDKRACAAIVLRYKLQLSYRQAAKVLRCHENEIEKHLKTAKDHIKQHLTA